MQTGTLGARRSQFEVFCRIQSLQLRASSACNFKDKQLKFVIESIGLTVAGGKELAVDLMTRLAGHIEHRFTFVAPDLDSYKAISGSNTCKIMCKKPSGLLRRSLLLNRMLPRICREERADALLCLGNFPPSNPPCPTVVLLHNPWMVYRDPVAERRRTIREKLIRVFGTHIYRDLPSRVAVITQTSVMKDRLCGRYGIDPARVAVIPNTFSVERMGESEAPPPSNRNERTRGFIFLCLCRYYAHKNIDIILDAVKKLSKYTCRRAQCFITITPHQHPGARRLLEELESSEYGSMIQNIGPIPNQRLPEVYRSANALIFPTLLESYSRTYLEAMHFGLPILTSDRDFARHLCQDAALYFDPLDADSLAKAMARLMEDQDLSWRLAENGRRVLAQVPTWDEIASRFVEVLERVARGQLAVSGESDSPHASDYARIV